MALPSSREKKRVVKKPGVHPIQAKHRTTINSSMFGSQEGGARPTIERGGTNMISMEVSGVGSRGGSNSGSAEGGGGGGGGGPPRNSLLSQTTKESFMRKKQLQHQSQSDEDSSDISFSLHTGLRKTVPLSPQDTSDASISSNSSTSAPTETSHRRSRQRRGAGGEAGSRSNAGGGATTAANTTTTTRLHHYHTSSDSGSGLSSRETARGGAAKTRPPPPGGKTMLAVVDVDSSSSGGGGGGCSPQEMDQALLESQVHASPEQGLKAAQQSLASEDWSSKCQGIAMVMCLARHYPHLLQPHLHTALLAVQKEVGGVWGQGWVGQ